jgi:hypothetical protein
MNTIEQIKKEVMEEFEGNFMNNGVKGVLLDRFQDERMIIIREFFINHLKILEQAIREDEREKIKNEIENILGDYNKGGDYYEEKFLELINPKGE